MYNHEPIVPGPMSVSPNNEDGPLYLKGGPPCLVYQNCNCADLKSSSI